MPKLDNENWYEHVPKLVERSREDTIISLWNQHVPTDKTIPNNIPNIKSCDNKRGTCMLGCVAFSGDCNMIERS
jgi:hypothetical protein